MMDDLPMTKKKLGRFILHEEEEEDCERSLQSSSFFQAQTNAATTTGSAVAAYDIRSVTAAAPRTICTENTLVKRVEPRHRVLPFSTSKGQTTSSDTPPTPPTTAAATTSTIGSVQPIKKRSSDSSSSAGLTSTSAAKRFRIKNNNVSEHVDGQNDSIVANKIKRYNPSSALKGVRFVLSGFQGALRGRIVKEGTELGAQYDSYWNNLCTHLICAFPNTPKFKQVVASGDGIIVTKEWFDACKRAGFAVPVQPFLLSDSTITTTAAASSSSSSSSITPFKQNTIGSSVVKNVNDGSGPSSYYCVDENSDMDTDDEISCLSDGKPSISVQPQFVNDNTPTLFHGVHALIYGAMESNLRSDVERYISSQGGHLHEYLELNTTHVISAVPWDKHFDSALCEHPNVIFVTPQWVIDSTRGRKKLRLNSYIIKG